MAIWKVKSLKINRFLSIDTSNMLLKFGLDIQSQTEVRVQKLKNPIRLPGYQVVAHGHKRYVYGIWNLNSKANSSNALENMPPTKSRHQKIQYGSQAAILKVTSLKINRLLPVYTSNVLLKFGFDIQSQTQVRVRKPKNSIWLLSGHFESDIAENK